jgi:hypothetical protein
MATAFLVRVEDFYKGGASMMKITGPTRIKVEIDGCQHVGFFEVHGDLVAVWLPEAGKCGKLEGLAPDERAAQLVRETFRSERPLALRS